jgi:hypothetical protein
VVGRAAPLLASRRVAAFLVVGAIVGAWFVIAPELDPLDRWPAILLVSLVVMPVTLSLVLIALPLWPRRWLLPAAVLLVLVAWGCTEADWGLAANFAKLWAAVFAGWAFLALFEELSWVVLIAFVTPLVDIISVWRGPTQHITTEHPEVYTAVAVAFVVPGGGAAYLGPPDILFFALFLAAADRWNLRVLWTWIATVGMYAFTVILANSLDVNGLPALPFLSFGFLVANGDLLWRRLRRPATPPSSSPAD